MSADWIECETAKLTIYMAEQATSCSLQVYLLRRPEIKAKLIYMMLTYHRYLLSELRPKTAETTSEYKDLLVDVPKMILAADALDKKLQSLQDAVTPKVQGGSRATQRTQREAETRRGSDSEVSTGIFCVS